MSQSFNLQDGECSHPPYFALYHTIGSYLGSDLDLDVPADRAMPKGVATRVSSGNATSRNFSLAEKFKNVRLPELTPVRRRGASPEVPQRRLPTRD
jgi:hypothetical protein